MLTPEQKLELIKSHFPSDISMWAVDGKFPAQSRLIDAAYAAGAKDMQERCAKVCDDLSSAYLNRWISNLTPNLKAKQESAESCSAAIKALETI